MCQLLLFPPQNWAWVYFELYLKQERMDYKNADKSHTMWTKRFLFSFAWKMVLQPIFYHLRGVHCTALTWGQCSGLISRLKIKWCNWTSNHQYFWIKATVANDKEKMKTRTVNFGPLRSCSCLWSKFESTLPIFWTEKLNQKLEEDSVYLLTHWFSKHYIIML